MNLKEEKVAVPVAVAVLVEAIVGLLIAIGLIAVPIGVALTTIITGSLVLIRNVVTPVEKVATLLNQPVEMVNDVLKGIPVP